METRNPFLAALDRAVTAIVGSADNAPNASPMDGAPGEIARAISAAIPGNPDAAMDNTRIINRPAPDRLANVPFPNLEQDSAFRAEVKARGFKVPPDVLKQIDDIDEPWMRLCAALDDYTDRAARERHRQHLESIAQRIAKDDPSHAIE